MFKVLGFKPTNQKLYQKALQHKSYDETENNERLEFLGDAIISTIVTKQLYIDYPQKQEGFLSKKRSYLIAREHLNIVGEQLLKGVEIKNKLEKISKSVYGNTLEAIIGAVFIDKGFCVAESLIIEKIYNSKYSNNIQDNDFKSKLQRESQKRNDDITYKVLYEDGPDHNKTFCVALLYNNKNVSEGRAPSIKEAEQKAAKEAYKVLF